MIDREEVLSGLECCIDIKCRDCPFKRNYFYPDCESALMRSALELLEEQEPVKPAVDIDTWKCGNCGHTLEHQELLGDNVLFHEQYNFCPECGRPVKWE